MAASTADTGFGITIEFASGFLAEIIGCKPPGPTREAIDVSHTTSPDNAKEFIFADLVDYGELTVDLNFQPDAIPPIDEPPEDTTINFPSGATWEFKGGLTGYEPDAPIDDRMTASATIKVTGKITITPATP